jgi:hypothetical protein
MNFSFPSSNELNIFDNSDPKYKYRLNFFRQITKTNCEISSEENRRIIERTISFYKKGRNSPQCDKMLTNLDIREEAEGNNFILNQGQNLINSGFLQQQNNNQQRNNNIQMNNIHINVNINKMPINIEESARRPNMAEENNLEDSFIVQLEKVFTTNIDQNLSEMKILEKNKQKFSNLHPVN